MKILVIDNFDSFTNNIVNFFRGLADGLIVDVVRNDTLDLFSDPAFASYDGFVISPGPGNPANPADLGISKAILETVTRPVLGICLGHQAMVIDAGGSAELAPEPMHGRTCLVTNTQKGLFAGLPRKISVMRYHSWIVNNNLPDGLVCDAHSSDGLIMGVRDVNRPRWGVQFHPESICTSYGRAILQNFLREIANQGAYADVKIRPSKPAKDVTRSFHWREISTQTCPIRLVEAQRAKAQRPPVLLESSMLNKGSSRFTFVEVPDGVERSVTYRVDDAEVHEFSGSMLVSKKKMSIFDYLEGNQQPSNLPDGDPPFGFVGGFVGWFGYELKTETLDVTSHTSATPDAAFREVTQFMVFDHAQDCVYACASLPHDLQKSVVNARISEIQEIAQESEKIDISITDPKCKSPVEFTMRHSREAYIDRIKACWDEIIAGESYELCLTNTISTVAEFDAWEFYKLLRQRNPSIYGGFVKIGGTEVASSSPERFLRLDHDSRMESKPIKGTAPRGDDAASDRALKQDLQRSEKERAENIMIVDLVRHDFSSVAVPGSIEVPKLCDIESHPAVHQMVSTVQARLRPDLSSIDGLRSSFPGGSMTGAPKIRSVQILDQLEEGPRGVYSGALGWIGYDGQLDLSIVIRTLVKHAGVSSIGCGGAITYLSNPQAELDEIMTKSRALMRTLAELVTGDPENYVFAPDADRKDVKPLHAKPTFEAAE